MWPIFWGDPKNGSVCVDKPQKTLLDQVGVHGDAAPARSSLKVNIGRPCFVIANIRFPVARALGYENYRFSASRAPGVGSANSITPRAKRACSMRVSFGADVGRLSCLRSQKRTARSLTASTVARSRCVMPARVRAARNCRPVTRLLLR